MPTTSRDWTCYSISDPRNGHVFYVGICRDCAKRFSEHLAAIPGKPTARRVRDIFDADCVPTFAILARFDTFQHALDFELDRIAALTLEGYKLANCGWEVQDALRAYAQKHPPDAAPDVADEFRRKEP